MYACLISLLYYDAYKILRAIVSLFISKLLQSSLCDGKPIYWQLYWSIKSLIFDILCRSFTIF